MNNLKSSGLKKFAHSIGQNWYHVVLIPKSRYPVFRQDYQRKLMMSAIEWVCKNHNINLFESEVMDDHVHLFISCPDNYSIRKLIQIIKGATSYYVRSKHPQLRRYKSLWSRGAMYRSVGNVSAEIVEKYIKSSNVWMDSFQRKLI